MKFVFLLFLIPILFFVSSSLTFAQTKNSIFGDLFNFDSIKLPIEVQGLFNTADKVQEGVKNTGVVQKLTDQVKECVTNGGTSDCIDIKNPSDAIESIRSLFSKINNWFQKTIGVSLNEIIRAIGAFFVWVLQWVAEFLRTILSKL